MQFYTDDECRAWMRGRGLGEGDWPTMDDSEPAPLEGKLGFTHGDASRLSSIFDHDSEVLLWVTLTRVWTANLHLYHRVRESYGASFADEADRQGLMEHSERGG